MKSKNVVILLVDNDSKFLNIRAEFLEGAGYQVLKASSVEEAKGLLSEAHIHLAILDIRLIDNEDEKDVSGLTLAKDPAYRSIPKIILTNYPSINSVREALGPTMDGLSPALDYVNKMDGPQVMIEATEKIFADFVKINWDLEVQSDPNHNLSLLYLTSLIMPSLPKEIFSQRVDELEDLFRRLFYNYQKVRIGRLLWSTSHQFCVAVLALSEQGTIDSYVLTCAEKQYLEQVRKVIEVPTSQSNDGTRRVDVTETTHFVADLYGLPNVDIENMQSIRYLLQTGKERPLKTALAHLLNNVLKQWHQHGQLVEENKDLMDIYRQWVGLKSDEEFRSQLDQRVDKLIQSVRTLGAIEIKRENQQITFHFPQQSPRSFPDPVATMYAPLIGYNEPVIYKFSPGKLTTQNIMVDSEQRTWLTDFANAGQAPQTWDFVCLEAAIRFESYQAPDLLAWQEFEESLMRPSELNEHLEPTGVIPELRANVVLIEQIRRQANDEISSDLIPYYAGLLAWVMEVMSHYDSGDLSTRGDRLKNAHLILAASMLAASLGTKLNNTPNDGRLLLDENDKVWIGSRYITSFSGLRLKLFRYLYEQAGQSVSTRAIVEKVYGDKYDALDRDQNQRLRQEISRLREAIEPRSGQPRYILTVREKGYLLQISGEPEKK